MRPTSRTWQGFSTSASFFTASTRSKCLFILPFVLALSLCIGLAALQIYIISLLHAHISTIDYTVDYGSRRAYIDTRSLPNTILLSASVSSSILFCFVVLGLWRLGRKASASIWAWTTIGLAVLTCILNVVFTVVVFLREREPVFNILDEIAIEAQKVATRETWLCSLSRETDGQVSTWAQPGCGAAKASRWLLVCLTMLSVLCFGMVVRGIFVLSRKSRTSPGDVGVMALEELSLQESQPPPYDYASDLGGGEIRGLPHGDLGPSVTVSTQSVEENDVKVTNMKVDQGYVVFVEDKDPWGNTMT